MLLNIIIIEGFCIHHTRCVLNLGTISKKILAFLAFLRVKYLKVLLTLLGFTALFEFLIQIYNWHILKLKVEFTSLKTRYSLHQLCLIKKLLFNFYKLQLAKEIKVFRFQRNTYCYCFVSFFYHYL